MMIQGWLARPGAGPGSRTVIPGPVRLTGLPGSLQAGACRGPNLRANSGCRGTTRILSVYVGVWRGKWQLSGRCRPERRGARR
jgi:hypothetical protein